MLFKNTLTVDSYKETGTILDDAKPGFGADKLALIVGKHNVDDELTGSEFGESIFGLSGDDTIYGEGGNDFIDGGSGADKLYGDGDDDTVIGGAGADRISGGEGNDKLWGHGENVPQTALSATEVDTFVFYTNDWGNDEIMDFQNGVDMIEFAQSSGVQFADLQITQGTTGTMISYDHNGVQSSIFLDGVSGIIDQNDFIF